MTNHPSDETFLDEMQRRCETEGEQLLRRDWALRLVALARRAPALTPEHTLVQIDWCISHYDRNDAALEMLRAYRKLVAQLHAPAPPEARP